MKRLMLMLVIMLSVVTWVRTSVVDAAANTATLTVSKRVSAPEEGITQSTVPLAGARYRVTLIEATGDAPVNAQNARTYQMVTGVRAFNVVLVTNQSGIAKQTGLELNATYLVQELAGAGVSQPAAPVALTFSAANAAYTYTPKSGLTAGTPHRPHALPSSFEPIGNGAVRKSGDAILQTGGQYKLPGRVLLLMMAGLLLLTGVGAGLPRKPRKLMR